MRPILVDITRTVSRAFKPVPTGIDRVERAYVLWFCGQPNSWFVASINDRTVVLDATGMLALIERIDGRKSWDQPTGLGWVWSLGGDTSIKRNATLRRLARWVFPRDKAASHLLQNIGAAPIYLNVGHTNLDRDWLGALSARAGARLVVMLHDMIPLDYPQFQTPESVDRFGKQAQAVLETADVVVTNSRATAARVRHWADIWGASPRIEPIHLGIVPPPPGGAVPAKTPYFLMLGTIEPRKGHGLILDAWEQMQPGDRPLLHLVGARGWKNEAVFARLDSSPMMGRWIFEHGPVPDDRACALLAGARALLFPSRAEGFGLPVLEALQTGIPVIASRLPVVEELAGNSALYIDSHDANLWATIITQIAKSSGTGTLPPKPDDSSIPRWDAHFRRLAAILAEKG